MSNFVFTIFLHNYIILLVSVSSAVNENGLGGVGIDLLKPQVPAIPVQIPVSQIPALTQLVSQSFEQWRAVMPTGNAANGIPLIDPFTVPFDIPITFNNPTGIAQFGYYQLVLSNMAFAGLSTFRVKSLNIDPVQSDLTFEDVIGNMSATTNYNLKYIISDGLPIPATLSEGSAYGAIYNTTIVGSAKIYPSPGNWFTLAQLAMTLSFEHFDVRIYPSSQYAYDPILQQKIMDNVYNGIQSMQPNLSALTQTTYSKTVSLQQP